MAVYRHTEFWCRPFFGTDLAQIPADTVMLVLELVDGRFCAVVPVVGNLCRSTLEAGPSLRMTTWSDDPCEGLAMVYAVSSSPWYLMEQCVSRALRLLDSGIPMRTQRPYPTVFEYLGWCSWDSMQIRVNEAGILEKCQEFKMKQIPVKWAIFDDMWAHIRDFYGRTYESFDQMVRMMHSCRLYIFAPMVHGFAAIGRTDKFISPKTLRQGTMELLEEGPCAWVQDGRLMRKGAGPSQRGK